MDWGLVLRWGLVLLGVALAAAVQTGLAYRTDPVVFLAPVVMAALALIVLQPMVGVYLALLAIPLELFEAQVGSAALSATEGLLLLTAVATVARSVVKRFELRASLHPVHIALVGLIVASALGLFVARDAVVVRQILVLWTSFLIVSILIGSASDQQLERILICLVVAGGVIGLVALLRASAPEVYQGGQEVSNRAQGTFGHPNQLAFFLILTIPIAIALVGRGRASLRLLGVTAAGVELAALLFTFSRSGIIGLVVALLILAAWPGFRRVAVLAVVAVAMFSAFNVDAISRNQELSLLAQRIQTVTTASGRAQNPRLAIYDTAANMIADRPWLGVGQRNFSEVSPLYGLRGNYGNPYIHAHDVFLTIAVETGLAGLAFFVAFIAMLARAAWLALRRRPDAYAVVLAVAAGLAGLLTAGITEYPLGINVVMATVLILAGVLVSYARSSPTRLPVTAGPEPRQAPGVPVPTPS
jgi:O-antigen ligase